MYAFIKIILDQTVKKPACSSKSTNGLVSNNFVRVQMKQKIYKRGNNQGKFLRKQVSDTFIFKIHLFENL